MGRTCPGPMMAPGQKEVPRTIHWSNAMAGAGLLMLLDDIAAILDDVALMTKVAARKSVAMADDVSVMTKVAAQKTAGVLGDDLALNAQQVTGVRADRKSTRLNSSHLVI